MFMVSMLLFLLALNWLNVATGMGMEERHIEAFVLPFVTIVFFLFVFPKLRKELLTNFIDKKNLTFAICVPILTSIVLVYIINGLRLVPVFLGEDVVGVGSAQYIEEAKLNTIGSLLFHAILPTFSEEFIFRFMAFSGVFLLIQPFICEEDTTSNIQNSFQRKIKVFSDNLFVKKKNQYIFIWLFIVSVIFAQIHGPDITNFYIYFIPGAFFGYFFIRYGFLSAWIAHGTFNALSGIAWSTILNNLPTGFL